MITREPIAELAESLRRVRAGGGTNAEVVRWLRAVSGEVVSVPMPVRLDPHRKYTRTLLHKEDRFEILILHWLPGCCSAIHDHGGARCWLTVASGRLGVENYLRHDAGQTMGYAAIGLEGREELEAGAIDHRQDDIHLHRCIARDEIAITLHVYARPIAHFNTFDERAQTCAEVIPTYDAVL
jgi:cysteine dioxygenase